MKEAPGCLDVLRPGCSCDKDELPFPSCGARETCFLSFFKNKWNGRKLCVRLVQEFKLLAFRLFRHRFKGFDYLVLSLQEFRAFAFAKNL